MKENFQEPEHFVLLLYGALVRLPGHAVRGTPAPASANTTSHPYAKLRKLT